MYLHLILGIIKHGLIKNMTLLQICFNDKRIELGTASALILLGAQKRTSWIFESCSVAKPIKFFIHNLNFPIMYLGIPQQNVVKHEQDFK